MGEITIRGTRAQQNLMEWSLRLADCQSNGMSVMRWCTEQNVKPKTYYNWQKKVFAAMLAQQQPEMSEASLTKPNSFACLPSEMRSNCIIVVYPLINKSSQFLRCVQQPFFVKYKIILFVEQICFAGR